MTSKLENQTPPGSTGFEDVMRRCGLFYRKDPSNSKRHASVFYLVPQPVELRIGSQGLGAVAGLGNDDLQIGVASEELTDLLANLPPATFGGNGFAELPEFSITARDISDIHVVALRGELDVVSANGLADALVEVAGSTVVVDLSGLTFIDCSGVAALVLARNRILANELGQLGLTRPGAIVRQVLEIVELSAWIVEWSSDWDEVTFRA